MVAKVTGIDWDTDGEEVDLPDSVTVEVDDDSTDEDIVNAASDDQGWLIATYSRIIRHRGGRRRQ